MRTHPFRLLATSIASLCLHGVLFPFCALYLASCSNSHWYDQATVQKAEVGKVKNLSTFGDRVYLAGQPTAEDFKALSDRGVKTVINLRTEKEMKDLGLDEAAEVKAAGMNYVNVPIGPEGPSDADLAKLMPLLAGAGKEPVLLHCASANRVGAVWSMFRATQQGVAAEAAIEEGKKVGLRAPELETRARSYISKYGSMAK